MDFLDEALEYNNKYKLDKAEVILIKIGALYNLYGYLDYAMDYYIQGLKEAMRKNDNLIIVNTYLYLGNLYYSKNLYNLAISTYQKTFQYFNSNQNDLRMLEAVTYNNIALSLYEMNQHDSINSYLYKGLEIREKIKDTLLIAHSYYYLADMNTEKNPKFAKNCIEISWDLIHKYSHTDLETYDENYALASIITTRAKIAIISKNNQVLKECQLCADSLFSRASNNTLLRRKWIKNAAISYLYLKDYKTALKYFLEVQEINLQLKNSIYILESYHDLKDIYSKLNDKNQAYEYSVLYYNLKDSLDNDELVGKLSSIADVEYSISFDEKMKTAEETKKHEDLVRNIIFGLAFIITLIGISIAIFIYKKYKIKNKLNQELHELNATKDKFFGIIAHDLKNPIGNLMQLSSLLESEYYNLEENERIDFIKSIDKSSNQIYNLLENLLTWSRSQKGSIEFDPQTNDLNFIAQNTLELLSQSAKNKNIILFNRIPKDSFAYFDTNMITTVVRNLISNSIKYTPDGGTIKIESELKEDCICISIIDNGVGIAPERVNDLFKIDATQSTPGTNDEKGTGLGLILCKDFVMKHKGELVVKSALGIGTSFTFSIPIK